METDKIEKIIDKSFNGELELSVLTPGSEQGKGTVVKDGLGRVFNIFLNEHVDFASGQKFFAYTRKNQSYRSNVGTGIETGKDVSLVSYEVRQIGFHKGLDGGPCAGPNSKPIGEVLYFGPIENLVPHMDN